MPSEMLWSACGQAKIQCAPRSAEFVLLVLDSQIVDDPWEVSDSITYPLKAPAWAFLTAGRWHRAALVVRNTEMIISGMEQDGGPLNV